MGNLWNRLKQQQKQSGAILLMNIVIVILCVILFFGGVKMVQELVDVFSRPRSAAAFMEMDIAAENYVPLVNLYHDDVVYGGFIGSKKKEYYGVAKYFEAASMYRAYSETGDAERAAREQSKMDAAYEEMGSWNIAADSIRAQLGLDKD